MEPIVFSSSCLLYCIQKTHLHLHIVICMFYVLIVFNTVFILFITDIINLKYTKNKSPFLLDIINDEKGLFVSSIIRKTSPEKLCDSILSTQSVSEQWEIFSGLRCLTTSHSEEKTDPEAPTCRFYATQCTVV
jgi:hypothetical protein